MYDLDLVEQSDEKLGLSLSQKGITSMRDDLTRARLKNPTTCRCFYSCFSVL